jgi:hypothetical protein
VTDRGISPRSNKEYAAYVLTELLCAVNTKLAFDVTYPYVLEYFESEEELTPEEAVDLGQVILTANAIVGEEGLH